MKSNSGQSTLVKPKINGIVFDLDGTIYLGDSALPGVVETIKHLRLKNKKILFVSNKPLQPASEYAAKLTKIGIPATTSDVITSAFVLGYYLSQNEPDLNLYGVGEESLIKELRSYNLKIVNEMIDQDPRDVINPAGIDAVVVSFDRTLDYRKLNTAYQAIQLGARFYATNQDKVCPMPGGAIPDAGATIKALEYITSKQVEMVAGKPSALMMKVAMQRMNLPPSQCLMVGDRLETDIKMGQDAGMFTAAILTGVSKMEDIKRLTKKPDFVLENLNELLDLIE